MTSQVDVSELSALVGSLELVISSLVVTHPDKALLAAKLTEVAHSVYSVEANDPGCSATARAVRYETVMGFAHLARHAQGWEYEHMR